MSDYPRLVINKQKLRNNIDTVTKGCGEKGLTIAGVVKGFNGLDELVWMYDESDCAYIADSRLERLRHYKRMGVQKPLMLLRLPMKNEVSELVKYVDISLNSVYERVEEINRVCLATGKTHDIILMLDLGDLREGIFDTETAMETALKIETRLKGIRLRGLGTNLGCYGAVKPSKTNIGKLLEVARAIEGKIGRKFDIISAGATSSLPLTLSGDMPSGATQLRVGEGIILAQDMKNLWHYDIPGLVQDAFILEAEVIEVEAKPTYPVGEIFIDAFGNSPTYEDEGMRKKALLGIGKQDIGGGCDIKPLIPGIRIMGGSSDHLICDIEDCKEDIRVGMILQFELFYESIIFTTSSKTLKKYFV